MKKPIPEGGIEKEPDREGIKKMKQENLVKVERKESGINYGYGAENYFVVGKKTGIVYYTGNRFDCCWYMGNNLPALEKEERDEIEEGEAEVRKLKTIITHRWVNSPVKENEMIKEKKNFSNETLLEIGKEIERILAGSTVELWIPKNGDGWGLSRFYVTMSGKKRGTIYFSCGALFF